MKAYVAGSWLRRDEIRGYAEELKKCGVQVTSRWIYTHGGLDNEVAALEDLEDIRKADTLISFTSDSSVGYNTGGRHVEFGYAWALGHDMIIIGPQENVFHSLVGDRNIYSDFKTFKKSLLVDATR